MNGNQFYLLLAQFEGYKNKYDTIEQRNVEDYLFFDESNPSSVYNCILNARNNALVVRTSFTPG